LGYFRDSAGALQGYDPLRMAALEQIFNVRYFRFWAESRRASCFTADVRARLTPANAKFHYV
jgi:hypothetical protein